MREAHLASFFLLKKRGRMGQDGVPHFNNKFSILLDTTLNDFEPSSIFALSILSSGILRNE